MTAQPTSQAGLDLRGLDGGRRHRPRLHPWLVFALAVIIAFFGLIYSRISLDRSAFVLEDLEQQIAAEEDRFWDLRVEVARLQSPDRIATIAEEMGMIYPAQLIALEVEGIDPGELDPEYRWAQLRALLTAQP